MENFEKPIPYEIYFECEYDIGNLKEKVIRDINKRYQNSRFENKYNILLKDTIYKFHRCLEKIIIDIFEQSNIYYEPVYYYDENGQFDRDLWKPPGISNVHIDYSDFYSARILILVTITEHAFKQISTEGHLKQKIDNINSKFNCLKIDGPKYFEKEGFNLLNINFNPEFLDEHIYPEEFKDKYFEILNKKSNNFKKFKKDPKAVKCFEKILYLYSKSKIKLNLLREIPVGCGFLIPIRITSDGKYIIGGKEGAYLGVWDFETGELVHKIEGWIYHVAISDDNKYFLNDGISQNKIIIWDLETGKFIGKIEGQKYISFLTMSRDNKYFIVGLINGNIEIWDFATREKVRLLNGNKPFIANILLSHDNKYILSNSRDGEIKIWDLNSGELIKNAHGILLSNYPKEGYYILKADHYENGTIIVKDLIKDKLIHKYVGIWTNMISVVASPNGKYIITGSDDQTIKIWDFKTEKLLYKLRADEHTVHSIIITADGKYIISASGDIFTGDTLKIWEFITDNFESAKRNIKLVPLREIHSEGRFIIPILITSDGENIIVEEQDRYWEYLGVRDFKTGEFIHKIEGWINNVIISNDNKYIITIENGFRDIKVRELETAGLIYTINREEYPFSLAFSHFIRSLAISRDDKYIIAGLENGCIEVWDFATGNKICLWEGHQSRVLTVMVTLDNKYILTHSRDGSTKFWDLEDRKEVYNVELDGYLLSTYPGTNYFILKSRYPKLGAIIVKNLMENKSICELKANWTDIVSAMASPDGKYIITSSEDHTIKIWEFETKELIYELKEDKYVIDSIAISSDGRYIIGVSKDIIKIWEFRQ